MSFVTKASSVAMRLKPSPEAWVLRYAVIAAASLRGSVCERFLLRLRAAAEFLRLGEESRRRELQRDGLFRTVLPVPAVDAREWRDVAAVAGGPVVELLEGFGKRTRRTIGHAVHLEVHRRGGRP